MFLQSYVVSVLENYFKSTFINILKCISVVDLKRIEANTKIPKYASDMFNKGEIDLYQKIACGYSFQKLDNIISTYFNCFNIDLKQVFVLKTFMKKTRYDIFNEFFSIRHNNVHKLEYDTLTTIDFIKYISIIMKTLNDIYKYLCKYYKVNRTESLLFHTSYKKNLEFAENCKNMFVDKK